MLPDIHSQTAVFWLLSQQAGENAARHGVLAITVDKRKARAGVEEWAKQPLTDTKRYKEFIWILNKPVTSQRSVFLGVEPGTGGFKPNGNFFLDASEISIKITNLQNVIFQHTHTKNLIFNAKDAITETLLDAASARVIGPRHNSLQWTLATSRRGRRNKPRKKFYFSSYCVRRCSRCVQQIHDFEAMTAGQRRPHFVLVPHPRRRSKIRKNETRIRRHWHRLLSQYQFSLSVLFHQCPIPNDECTIDTE